MKSLEERFWAKVLTTEDEVLRTEDCWMWRAALRNGYGVIGRGSRGSGVAYAHRLAFEWLVGPIPDNLTIDHLCRNRACVNPAHMEPVTRGENVRRGEAGLVTGARTAARTHCVNGHPFDETNTRFSGGRRTCRTCAREHMRRRRQQAVAI